MKTLKTLELADESYGKTRNYQKSIAGRLACDLDRSVSVTRGNGGRGIEREIMTATELLNEIKPGWRDVTILVKDGGEAVEIRSINYITTAKGNRVVVIGNQTPYKSENIADAEETP